MRSRHVLKNGLIAGAFLFVCALSLFVFGCSNNSDEVHLTKLQKEAISEVMRVEDATNGDDDLLMGKSSGYSVSLPFDWGCEEYINDRNFCFQMHSFTFLDDEYHKWIITGDSRYKNMIIDWINDWVESNPKVDLSNKLAWHDDATARRVYRISVYADLWRTSFTETEFKAIKESLTKQSELLASEDFYTEKHNHGMFQDMALVAYSLLQGSDRERTEYLGLAKHRSKEYFNYVFTSEGVHKEHSPEYHMLVATDGVTFFRDVYSSIDKSFSSEMNDLYKLSAHYYTQLVMPDSTLPSIGDSRRSVAAAGVYDTAEYEWARTGGSEGSPPERVAVFPKSGYAVFRSSWQDAPQRATYILFLAATHSSTHKHGDDLSFLIYHGGDLFSEVGNKDYTYKDEMTAYTYSGYAHNVLTVGGRAYPVDTGSNGFQAVLADALKTQISDYDITSEASWVTGEQYRFEGIVQKRTLAYDKTGGVVTITDAIQSDRTESASLIYHLASDVEAIEKNNGWHLYRKNKLVAKVSFTSRAKLSFSTVTGTGKKPYYSVLFEGSKQPKESSLLKVDFGLTPGETDVDMLIELMPL